jgi:hypothetical protein
MSAVESIQKSKTQVSVTKNGKTKSETVETMVVNDGVKEQGKVLSIKKDETGTEVVERQLKPNEIKRLKVQNLPFKVMDVPRKSPALPAVVSSAKSPVKPIGKKPEAANGPNKKPEAKKAGTKKSPAKKGVKAGPKKAATKKSGSKSPSKSGSATRKSGSKSGSATRKSGRKSGSATRKSGSATRKSGSASRKSGSASRKSGSATRKSGSASRKSGSATRKSGSKSPMNTLASMLM